MYSDEIHLYSLAISWPLNFLHILSVYFPLPTVYSPVFKLEVYSVSAEILDKLLLCTVVEIVEHNSAIQVALLATDLPANQVSSVF